MQANSALVSGDSGDIEMIQGEILPAIEIGCIVGLVYWLLQYMLDGQVIQLILAKTIATASRRADRNRLALTR